MPPLNKFHRNKLEAAVGEARRRAEAGARSALGYLGVAEASPPPYLSEKHSKLRQRLIVHGRQLGDALNDGDEPRAMARLVEETAYEHWHRMLFARFLAESGMLMFPGPSGPVPVTLGDCSDFAAGEGAADGWDLAARYAARMLPQIFLVGSPVFEIVFPAEHRQDLETVIASLPPETYAASDAWGWCAQYWQSSRKAEINASEVKIGERELPAVTQLFTEPFMVTFLLDNSLGAWWAARSLAETDVKTARDEAELRRRASLPGVPLDYLRFVKDVDGPWAPASGKFKYWPDSLANFRMLDPCCGSGHFLVAAFRMLVPMRMESEGLSAREAVDAVLRENIHGLELDRRCVEIAVFSLAMAAWTYPDAGGYRELPELNVACSGIAVGSKKEAWTALAGRAPALEEALAGLYDSFSDAPVLGSLIFPGAANNSPGLYEPDWAKVKPLLDMALSAEGNYERTEAAVAAKVLAEAASLLDRTYTLIATNVPYLSSGKQSDLLKEHCRKYYHDAKGDLATVFLDRCLRFCSEGGTVAAVTPQNWLSLTSYAKFRKRLLEEGAWHLVARLGEGGFDSPAAAGAFVAMLCLGRTVLFPDGSVTSGEERIISFIDASELKGPERKAEMLAAADIAIVSQARQLDNPDARVSAVDITSGELLQKFAYSYHGLTTGDVPRMSICFWEQSAFGETWVPFHGTVAKATPFGGMSLLLRWNGGNGDINELKGARKDGTEAWRKMGVIVSQMRALPVSLYKGGAFDVNTSVIAPYDNDHIPAIWCYCSSPDYNDAVRKIDQKLNVTSATLVKVPFDVERWTQVAKAAYPNGLPKPYTDDPTQWIFHGHPCGSVVWDDDAKRTVRGPLRMDGTVLHIAVA
ncbi:MAG: N-6 DNA methylase, partial [Deltaproteobacteria bacterium]|nr:N-6 DNA methylase [Deltaproteobacteria bacterium]